MYALALVFVLSGNDTKSEVIGAFNNLSQCISASMAYASETKCYYWDQQKGLVEVDSDDYSG